jgi:hypothetical protein
MFTAEQAAAYLAAMIDGEGWIGEPKNKRNRGVRIANTDPALISAIIECCMVLDLHYTVTRAAGAKPHWASQATVHIGGLRSLERVQQLCPIRAPAKQDRLARTLPTFRQPVDIMAVNHMRNQGMTLKAIAQELGVSYKRVRFAVKRAHRLG